MSSAVLAVDCIDGRVLWRCDVQHLLPEVQEGWQLLGRWVFQIHQRPFGCWKLPLSHNAPTQSQIIKGCLPSFDETANGISVRDVRGNIALLTVGGSCVTVDLMSPANTPDTYTFTKKALLTDGQFVDLGSGNKIGSVVVRNRAWKLMPKLCCLSGSTMVWSKICQMSGGAKIVVHLSDPIVLTHPGMSSSQFFLRKCFRAFDSHCTDTCVLGEQE